MRGDAIRKKDLEAVACQQVPNARQRVIPQVFMIDRVVLQRLDEAQEIVRLRNEGPVVGQEPPHVRHDAMHVFDVGKDIRRRHHFCLALLAADPLGRLGGQEGKSGRNAAVLCQRAHLRRFDAVDEEAGSLEVAQKRPVIGANVDHQVPRLQTQQRSRLAAQFGKVLAQDPRRAAGIGVFRRKEDLRIDHQAELHELAVPATQKQRRIGRLLARSLSNGPHLIDGRQITEEQNRFELALVADLTAFDDGARTGARRSVASMRSCLVRPQTGVELSGGARCAFSTYHWAVRGSPRDSSIFGE